MSAQATWRKDLLCYVNSIDYDARKKTGTIRMPDGSCTDMSGAIRLFTKKIDHRVRVIRTYAGGKPDTAYFRIDGEWEAFLPEEVAAWERGIAQSRQHQGAVGYPENHEARL